MKATIFIIILFCTSCKIYKQDTTTPLNAIFILFEQEDMNIKFEQNENKDKLPEFDSTIYRFKLNEKDYIQFIYQKFLNFDARENNKISKVIIKRKRFLKNNKIINFNTIKNWGLYKSTMKTIGLTKIFIIDKSEFKNNKIVLRQVSVFSSYSFEE